MQRIPWDAVVRRKLQDPMTEAFNSGLCVFTSCVRLYKLASRHIRKPEQVWLRVCWFVVLETISGWLQLQNSGWVLGSDIHEVSSWFPPASHNFWGSAVNYLVCFLPNFFAFISHKSIIRSKRLITNAVVQVLLNKVINWDHCFKIPYLRHICTSRVIDIRNKYLLYSSFSWIYHVWFFL